MIDPITNQLDKVMLTLDNTIVVFGTDNPNSSNYANFKEQILAGKAELQDADGNTMSSEAAQTFVRGLP